MLTDMRAIPPASPASAWENRLSDFVCQCRPSWRGVAMGSGVQTFKSVFGIARAVVPVLYCGGLVLYFLNTSGGSWENVDSIGMGPTVLGLGVVGFLFCIPPIIKIMLLLS